MSALESLAIALIAVVLALTARGFIEVSQPTHYHLTGGAP